MEAAACARRARAVEELRRRLSAVAEFDGTSAAAEQECNHFSLRGYVAMLQKKDPTLCSDIFRNHPQYDEDHDLSPMSKYHRWDCSKCLDRLKASRHRPTSENVSMKHDGMNDDCSIRLMTHPSVQNVDPPYPIGQTATPPAELKNVDPTYPVGQTATTPADFKNVDPTYPLGHQTATPPAELKN